VSEEFRPERMIDEKGNPSYRPNRWAGWAKGTLPATYQQAVERCHQQWALLQQIPVLERQLEALRARSLRQTHHAARLERKVVRQRDALRAAYEELAQLRRWKVEATELLVQWDGQRDALRAAYEELAQLRRWKVEATELLVQWDEVHDALGSPARIGESKVAASRRRALEVRA
jgi:hypothetical protein